MVIVTMIFGTSIASEEKIDNSGAAQLLLQSLGQKTNTLDSNFGELFHEFVTSKEKTNISAGQFLSTFYNSLTRESTVVLLTLPLILLMMTLLATLVSLPTLVTFLATSYSRADNIDDIHTKDYDEVLSYIDNQESTYNDPRYYQY